MALSGDTARARRVPDKPETIDLTVPSPARMYDYYLSGKDNFPADREAAEAKRCCSCPPGGNWHAQTGISWSAR